MPEYLALEDCRSPEDLDRIDPRAYAELAGKPASMLDLFRQKLEIAAALDHVVQPLRDARS